MILTFQAEFRGGYCEMSKGTDCCHLKHLGSYSESRSNEFVMTGEINNLKANSHCPDRLIHHN